ncbi:ABC transporter permease subunit, partial [Thauera sp.]
MDANLFTSMLFATVVAGTPLIIVALGLLVSERAGVLNLGAEGMMAMGAVTAFAITHHSGSP